MTKNTFTRKPSCFQLISYSVLLLTLLLLHLLLLPSLRSPLRLPLHLLAALLLLSLIVSAGLASALDPGYKVKKAKDQTFYCDQCMILVDASCKHCKACQQCVEGFDHHCKWINNCIGRKNYSTFCVMISNSALYLALYCSCCIVSIVETNGQTTAGLLVSWIWSAGVLVLLGLNAYLILFHIWINWKGISTYEYLQLEKISEESRNKRKVEPCSDVSNAQLN